MKTKKPTIGTRIEIDELAEIDVLVQVMGQSRSEWLNHTIKEALGHPTTQAVQSMDARITKLEKRFRLLAG